MAEEKNRKWLKWLRETFVWTRNLHWLWTLFPAGWKATIPAATFTGITALLALIGKTRAVYWWLYSLAVLAGYILLWIAVQRFAPNIRTNLGKPFFSLEAFDGEIHAHYPAGTPYFFLRNCGQRTARNLRFDPIESRTGCKIWIDGISSLAPTDHRVPLGFHAGEDGDYKGVVGHLINFFEGGSSSQAKLAYPVTLHFLDGVDELTEQHVVEGNPLPKGGIKLKIVPATGSLLQRG